MKQSEAFWLRTMEVTQAAYLSRVRVYSALLQKWSRLMFVATESMDVLEADGQWENLRECLRVSSKAVDNPGDALAMVQVLEILTCLAFGWTDRAREVECPDVVVFRCLSPPGDASGFACLTQAAALHASELAAAQILLQSFMEHVQEEAGEATHEGCMASEGFAESMGYCLDAMALLESRLSEL